MMRILIALLLCVLLAAGAGYFLLEHRHETELEGFRQAQSDELTRLRADHEERLAEMALDAARVLAAGAEGLLGPEDAGRLEEMLAAAVSGHRLVGVIVLDSDGSVLSSTDLRFRGRQLEDPATREALAVDEPTIMPGKPVVGELEVAAPLGGADQRFGAVRVFFELGPVEEA
jgi:hypothetical protein